MLPKSEFSYSLSPWTRVEKIIFRFTGIYFLIQAVPLDRAFYRDLFMINWGAFYYRDLFNLSRYAPHFFGPNDTFINWAVVALIALVGTIIRTSRDQKRANYAELYYWLRVVLRYRAGIGIIGFVFTKLLPTQLPYPSLGLLNTNFGDLTAKKIYWLSIGIAPWHQVFTGVVEVHFRTQFWTKHTPLFGTYGTGMATNPKSRAG